MCGRPCRLFGSGREFLSDVREWWETLPDVQEWSGGPLNGAGGPPGCLVVV